VTAVIWSPQALLDLHSIRDYIAHDSPRYADVVVQRLIQGLASVSRGDVIEAQPRSRKVAAPGRYYASRAKSM